MIDIGVIELNRNVGNYFAETEQSAFSPSNLIPGIGVSPDKMLQARIFTYPDAHRYRVGANYNDLPVNYPHAVAVNNYQRGGAMAGTCCPFDHGSASSMGGCGSVNYGPNSKNSPAKDASVSEPALKISGDANRYAHGKDN